MNTRPDAIKILCYGDSNTYGQKPDKSGRYAADVRWTGLLQDMLGSDYWLIEEGLGGRTTDLEHSRKPGRNGKSYLTPCLQSHNPIDVVVIMLGTNDLKIDFRRSAEDIATAIEGLITDVRTYAQDGTAKLPKIILMSPIEINATAPRFSEFYTGIYDDSSMQESQKLADAIQAIAQQKDCIFLDAAQVSTAGEDGIHFAPEAHEPLARLIAETIRTAA